MTCCNIVRHRQRPNMCTTSNSLRRMLQESHVNICHKHEEIYTAAMKQNASVLNEIKGNINQFITNVDKNDASHTLTNISNRLEEIVQSQEILRNNLNDIECIQANAMPHNINRFIAEQVRSLADNMTAMEVNIKRQMQDDIASIKQSNSPQPRDDSLSSIIESFDLDSIEDDPLVRVLLLLSMSAYASNMINRASDAFNKSLEKYNSHRKHDQSNMKSPDVEKIQTPSHIYPVYSFGCFAAKDFEGLSVAVGTNDVQAVATASVWHFINTDDQRFYPLLGFKRIKFW